MSENSYGDDTTPPAMPNEEDGLSGAIPIPSNCCLPVITVWFLLFRISTPITNWMTRQKIIERGETATIVGLVIAVSLVVLVLLSICFIILMIVTSLLS
jgi:uncharacterized membrane protein YidH (DUF202 family)